MPTSEPSGKSLHIKHVSCWIDLQPHTQQETTCVCLSDRLSAIKAPPRRNDLSLATLADGTSVSGGVVRKLEEARMDNDEPSLPRRTTSSPPMHISAGEVGARGVAPSETAAKHG